VTGKFRLYSPLNRDSALVNTGMNFLLHIRRGIP
jgi:hypothetical protein